MKKNATLATAWPLLQDAAQPDVLFKTNQQQ